MELSVINTCRGLILFLTINQKSIVSWMDWWLNCLYPAFDIDSIKFRREYKTEKLKAFQGLPWKAFNFSVFFSSIRFLLCDTKLILHYNSRVHAPAIYNLNGTDSEDIPVKFQGVLGPIPHTIRGFLHSYQTVAPTCAKFKQCIACSETVLNKYKAEGLEFLLKVFNSGNYLEEVTGLHELHLSAEMTEVSWITVCFLNISGLRKWWLKRAEDFMQLVDYCSK